MNEPRIFATVAEMNEFYRDLLKRRDRQRAPPARPKPRPAAIPPPPPPPSPSPLPPVAVDITRLSGTMVSIPDLGKIVMKQVSIVFELPIESLTSQRRIMSYAKARQAGYFIARKLGRASLSQLGRIFKRDHSTILHGWRQAAKRKLDVPEYQQKMDWVMDRVRHVVIDERKQTMPTELTDEEVLHVGQFPKRWSKHGSQASANDREASA